ncbi:MAG: DNA primase, partial [Candidatus Pacebacteria bacterium]|nr:DNA primase [Candidatus Paceibacterota bacterium]
STIKERLPITDVVSSYIRLEKAGNYMRALCPFHNEKTPSFYVSPSRGTYRCFGCGKGGDVISFVEAIEGLTFREALVRLADRAGVELVYEKKSPEDYRKTLLIKINESAKDWFCKNLNEDSRARTYLSSRGLNTETIQKFSVGVALTGWDGLTSHLRHEGYKDADIVDAGLAIEGNKGIYDRFRGRIMFPIRDGVGRTVAFTGRIIPGTETDKDAKYVNSPETPIYSKSNILFGYDMAKSTLLREGRVVLVEGQMDLLMAHQAGTEGIVAISGTALTEAHVELLKRFTDNLVFSLDADSAGVKASERSIEIALRMGMNVEMILIPEGKDPADIIKENSENWKKIVNERKHIIDFLLYVFARPRRDERARIRDVTTHVLPAIASVPNALEEAHFIKKVAEVLKMEEQTIRKEVEKIRMMKVPTSNPPKDTQKEMLDTKKRYQIIEDELLSYLTMNSAEKGDIQKEYERIRGKTYKEILGILDDEKKETLLFKRDIQWKDGPPSIRYAEELLYEFEKAFLEEKLKRTTILLRQAEKEKNKDNTTKYLLESRHLLATIHALVAPHHTK